MARKHKSFWKFTKRNPGGGELAKSVAIALGGAALGILGAWGVTKIPRTSFKTKSGVLMGGAVAVGALMHIKGFAPNVGKAVMAGGLAIGGLQLATEYRYQSYLDRITGGTGSAQQQNLLPLCTEGQTPAANGCRTAGYVNMPWKAPSYARR